MNRLTKFILAAGAACLFGSFPALASNLASDYASNYSSWGGGSASNLGTNFGAWSFSTSGNGGSYLGATAESGTSFGIYSGGDGTTDGNTDLSSVTRQFTGGALSSGQTFAVDLANTTVLSSSAPGVFGLNLLAGSTVVFTLKFTGGQSDWDLNDGGSDFGIAQGFEANTPLLFTFTYNGGNSYSYTFGSASGNDFTASDTISGITAVKIFDNNQGGSQNLGFDSLLIVPEPSTIMMLLGSSLFGSFYLIRRRRK